MLKTLPATCSSREDGLQPSGTEEGQEKSTGEMWGGKFESASICAKWRSPLCMSTPSPCTNSSASGGLGQGGSFGGRGRAGCPIRRQQRLRGFDEGQQRSVLHRTAATAAAALPGAGAAIAAVRPGASKPTAARPSGGGGGGGAAAAAGTAVVVVVGWTCNGMSRHTNRGTTWSTPLKKAPTAADAATAAAATSATSAMRPWVRDPGGGGGGSGGAGGGTCDTPCQYDSGEDAARSTPPPAAAGRISSGAVAV
ncbi:hypothetical protein TSOC_011710 [Tetrabaena socialis]|uniref:Uncharacterized protein n=1 Tax=Tetrabaena socialis TaxID=47790 RepID=A0A2J7ZPZ3_9CHLO|nr:hypothetical protein TSOC_011710 [Tetrabaena socialis]|eukprot:PNH02335.1 hypothetical protein TSOC_011710 [Tetrabaena socialis]